MAAYSDGELQAIAGWLREGLSASRISAAFSALRGSPVSRNAIIGIVHRNPMLGAIGFASGRARVACEPAASKRADGTSGKGRPNGKTVAGKAGMGVARRATVGANQPQLKREPSLRQPPRLVPDRAGVLVADGQTYPFKVPVAQSRPIGRQPHGVAMRFIDCLFGRCRAPLDLVLEDDPENDAPGSRPGADMLCCGMRTKALSSYCSYHQARFQRRVCA